MTLNLTAYPAQEFNFSRFTINIRFYPSVSYWGASIYDNDLEDYIIQGIRLSICDNILQGFSRDLRIWCEGEEPTALIAFSYQLTTLNIELIE